MSDLETRPTPGPWHVQHFQTFLADEWHVTDDDHENGFPICVVATEAEANLIASAVNACYALNPDDPLQAAKDILRAVSERDEDFARRELNTTPAPLSVPLPTVGMALLALPSTEDLLAKAAAMLTGMGIPADEQDALFADCCAAGGVENEPTDEGGAS